MRISDWSSDVALPISHDRDLGVEGAGERLPSSVAFGAEDRQRLLEVCVGTLLSSAEELEQPPAGQAESPRAVAHRSRAGERVVEPALALGDRAAEPVRPRGSAGDRHGGLGIACCDGPLEGGPQVRSEEHTSELQSLLRISYAV